MPGYPATVYDEHGEVSSHAASFSADGKDALLRLQEAKPKPPRRFVVEGPREAVKETHLARKSLQRLRARLGERVQHGLRDQGARRKGERSREASRDCAVRAALKWTLTNGYFMATGARLHHAIE